MSKTKIKEKGLLRKLIDIYWEQAMRRRAVRNMSKLSWSLDYLSLMLVKASRIIGSGVQLVIQDTSGKTVTLTYDKALQSDALKQLDDDIFNHLDDDTALNDFIRKHSTR